MKNTGQKTSTVLLLEPNPQVRYSITSALNSSDFSVAESYEFEATLKMLKAQNFDILLCCSSPRSMDCDQLAVHAKELQPDIKVVVATTYTEHPSLRHVKEVDLLLLKPFDLPILVSFIKELVKGTAA